MAEKNYFVNGITELLILSILNTKDSYVYEITKLIEENSNGILSISQNTIYTATYKLQSEGRISEYSKLVGKRRTRIYYHLEESGIFYLKKLRKNYYRMNNGVQSVLNLLSYQEEREDQTNEQYL